MNDIHEFHDYLTRANLDCKPHQEDGVRWCISKETNGHDVSIRGDGDGDDNDNCSICVRGGIIADEMGLGKTIVMIGVIISNVLPNTLIVLPRALLEQWETVFIRTAGHRPLVYHGSRKYGVTEDALRRAPVVLTTYGTVSGRKLVDDETEFTSLLHKVKWNRIIFDEAHHLRNVKTRAHQSALQLNADVRWLVTGTPIQNSESDLYSLCDVLALPKDYYINPDSLTIIVKELILKRTKRDVGVKLPELKAEVITVEWEDENERRLAEDIHSQLEFSNVEQHSGLYGHLLDGLCHCSLVSLLRARQMCVYPPLIKAKINTILDTEQHANVKIYDVLTRSSKLDAVANKILERKDNAKSKLVFCHYRGEIDALQTKLTNACGGGGLRVETFDGRTESARRADIITGSCDVLILQIQTGCEGLNLQHFSEVYFVSPHWNPAVEDQAVARCHRIGQKLDVHVFRFKMKSFDEENTTVTIDAYIEGVQDTKRGFAKIIELPTPNGDGGDDGGDSHHHKCFVPLP